jgi:hypothetical protein
LVSFLNNKKQKIQEFCEINIGLEVNQGWQSLELLLHNQQ